MHVVRQLVVPVRVGTSSTVRDSNPSSPHAERQLKFVVRRRTNACFARCRARVRRLTANSRRRSGVSCQANVATSTATASRRAPRVVGSLRVVGQGLEHPPQRGDGRRPIVHDGIGIHERSSQPGRASGNRVTSCSRFAMVASRLPRASACAVARRNQPSGKRPRRVRMTTDSLVATRLDHLVRVARVAERFGQQVDLMRRRIVGSPPATARVGGGREHGRPSSTRARSASASLPSWWRTNGLSKNRPTSCGPALAWSLPRPHQSERPNCCCCARRRRGRSSFARRASSQLERAPQFIAADLLTLHGVSCAP